jgi:hypothetical protein
MGHNDIGLDVDGSEVLIWPSGSNTADMGGQVCPVWGMVKVKLDDASKSCVLPVNNWDLVEHCAVRDVPGWAMLSTYTIPSLDPAYVAGKAWTPLMSEIFRMSMDGKTIQRLCHHQSGPFNYTRSPRASANRDFTKVVYNSNFGNTASDSYVDVYMMTLPPVPSVQPPPKPAGPVDWTTKEIGVRPKADGTVDTVVRDKK